MSFDLDAYTGNVVDIRFFFDTMDELDNDNAGWFVDDVIVIFEDRTGDSDTDCAALKDDYKWER